MRRGVAKGGRQMAITLLQARPQAAQRQDARAKALVTLAIGSIIAIVGPFDVAFGLATGDSALLRAVALPALGLAGLFFAGRVGLTVPTFGLRHPWRTPLAVAFAVAAGVAAIDGFIFRSLLLPDYVEYFRNTDDGERLFYFMLRAFNEQILYRLFLMSFLVWCLGLLWRGDGGRPADGAYWVAMTLAQIANIAINMPLPATPGMLCYDFVRYICPGIVWGYLYWRHGFMTAEVAHVGTHPFLQPALGYLLG
jgi:hypothetical protein